MSHLRSKRREEGRITVLLKVSRKALKQRIGKILAKHAGETLGRASRAQEADRAESV